MSYRGQDLLLQFIEKDSGIYDAVFSAVQKFAGMNKQTLFREEALQNAYINEDNTDIDLKKAYEVRTSEDILVREP